MYTDATIGEGGAGGRGTGAASTGRCAYTQVSRPLLRMARPPRLVSALAAGDVWQCDGVLRSSYSSYSSGSVDPSASTVVGGGWGGERTFGPAAVCVQLARAGARYPRPASPRGPDAPWPTSSSVRNVWRACTYNTAVHCELGPSLSCRQQLQPSTQRVHAFL